MFLLRSFLDPRTYYFGGRCATTILWPLRYFYAIYGAMEYLTPKALLLSAPAAAKLSDKSDGLLDTNEFLKFMLQQHGQRPVLAVQGTGHSDAKIKPQHGRHLIVTAGVGGSATALLNSHTVHRKAWMATGFVRDVKGEPVFVAGAAMPLQRWRGVQPPYDSLRAWDQSLILAKGTLRNWEPTGAQLRAFVKDFAASVYLPGHRAVSPDAFEGPFPPTMWDIMFGLVDKVLDGDLPSADGLRRVKPIKGPDAMLHLASAAFRTAVEHAHDAKKLPAPMILPGYIKT